MIEAVMTLCNTPSKRKLIYDTLTRYLLEYYYPFIFFMSQQCTEQVYEAGGN